MKKYTVTLKDNETDEEMTVSGDNLILGLTTKIPNTGLLKTEACYIGGVYVDLCRNLTALAKSINEAFSQEITEEDKKIIEEYKKEEESKRKQ